MRSHVQIFVVYIFCFINIAVAQDGGVDELNRSLLELTHELDEISSHFEWETCEVKASMTPTVLSAIVAAEWFNLAQYGSYVASTHEELFEKLGVDVSNLKYFKYHVELSGLENGVYTEFTVYATLLIDLCGAKNGERLWVTGCLDCEKNGEKRVDSKVLERLVTDYYYD